MKNFQKTNRHQILVVFALMIMALAAVSCASSRQTTRKKNCDCPRWSYSQPANTAMHARA